ncbi:Peptidase M50B-like [Quadrisphaera sp. DSM 44207]|nr:Peptidase M50B-like [Quadrisphaera sp. DSM 44207]
MAQLLERVSGAQPAPPPVVVLATAVAALALVALRPAWARARHVVTIVHEGAHGVVAALAGRRLRGIRLHSDSSGVAVSAGRPTGAGMVLTAAAGYPGPALLGLGAAAVLGTGHAVALLWGLLAALALLLVQVRTWFGLWSVLVLGAVLVGVTLGLPEQAQSAFAHLVAWFLLLAAPRTVLELASARRRQRAPTSDADQLARLTGVPAPAWVAAFLLLAAAALALGGRWLLAGALGG